MEMSVERRMRRRDVETYVNKLNRCIEVDLGPCAVSWVIFIRKRIEQVLNVFGNSAKFVSIPKYSN